MIYEPNDDSYLLVEFVKKYASGKVLDMGRLVKKNKKSYKK